MPIVTAAGYPTLVSPNVEAAPTPGADYQNIQASSDAFGAGVGRAQQQLGDTFEKASNQFEAVALRQQELTNQIAANNSTNYVMDEVQKILHGDPNKPGDVGYYGLKGNDAINARQSTMKAMDDLITNARGQLTNPRQQFTFDSETRRMRNYWMGQVGTHYDQQLNVATAASLTASRQLAEHQQASAAANIDEVGFGLGVQKEMEAANQQAQHLGFDQTWLDNEYDKIRAKATKQWVDSLGVKNPLAADEFLEHNKDALLPGEYRQLKGELHSRAITQKAQEANYGVPPGQQPTEPSKIKGGLVRGGAVQGRIDQDQVYQLAIKHGFKGQAADTMAGIIMAESSGDPNAIGDQNIGGSFGLTQINLRAHGEKAREALGNPDRALELAFDVSKGGTDFTPWTMYRNGEYKKYLGGNRPADGTPDTVSKSGIIPLEDNAKTRANWEFFKQDIDGLNKDITYDQYRQMFGNPGMGSNPNTDAQPHVQPAAVVGGTDKIIRPLPPLEPNELPDAQVPGLPERIQQLAKKLPPPDAYENREVWNAAVKIARQDLNMAYANQQHQQRIQQEQIKAQDEQVMAQYQRNMTQGNPNYPTTNQVLADTRLSPTAQRTMVGFIERQTKVDPAAEVSKQNTMDFFRRMTLPDGEPEKLRDMQEVNDSYISGKLTQHDHDWLVSQDKKERSEGDETFKERKNRWMHAVEHQIIGPLGAAYATPEQVLRFQEYKDAVDKKIDEYRKQNKNPQDLFDRTKSDSVTKPEFIQQFAAPIKEQVRADPTTLDLSTEQKVIEAYQANRIAAPKAIEALQKFGYTWKPKGENELRPPVR